MIRVGALPKQFLVGARIAVGQKLTPILNSELRVFAQDRRRGDSGAKIVSHWNGDRLAAKVAGSQFLNLAFRHMPGHHDQRDPVVFAYSSLGSVIVFRDLSDWLALSARMEKTAQRPSSGSKLAE